MTDYKRFLDLLDQCSYIYKDTTHLHIRALEYIDLSLTNTRTFTRTLKSRTANGAFCHYMKRYFGTAEKK